MATLTTNQLTVAGIAQTLVAAAGGGDKVQPGDNVWIVVANGGGSPITVTITCVNPSNYGTLVNGGGSVTNGTTSVFGPIKANRFAAVADGLAAITYSGVTSVTVGAFTT